MVSIRFSDTLTTEQLASRWGVTNTVLRMRRLRGTGPKWFTVGRLVFYAKSEIIKWEKENGR